MDLFSILLNINDYADDQTLYVQLNWTLESETKVISPIAFQLSNQYGEGYRFFLEVYKIKYLLNRSERHNLCLRESCQKMIEYALDQP